MAYSSHGNRFYVKLYSIPFTEKVEWGRKFEFFTFERSIREGVVTFRLDVAFGSLHMQQLHGFDELRKDQGIIQNRSARIDKTSVLFYISAAYLFFDFVH
jgi:hypothetical protein